MSASISFADSSYCIGSGYMMPDFGLLYTYNVGCTWTGKAISESRMVPFYATEKTKSILEARAASKLSQLGVISIAVLGPYKVYSNVPRTKDELFCIVNDRSLGGYDSIACDDGVKLSTDALNKESNTQILINNGFSKVADVKNVSDWGGRRNTVSIFSKK